MLVRPNPDNSNPLWEYFSKNGDRLIHKWCHYFDVYHNHFHRFIGEPVTILEIGINHGGSLQMWKHYFGPKAKIYGIDVNPKCRAFEEDQIKILIGDQGDREFLRNVKTSLNSLDIIIDDGGHTMSQQTITFEELFSCVNESGIYLVEDMHTSYWPQYGGGYRKKDSFVEYSKNLIDQLNAWHSKTPELSVSGFTRSTTGIHFYDGMLVIEKYPNTLPPKALKKGTASF